MTLAQSNLVLLLTAAMWGSSFVLQKMAMDIMEPFIYNALRFALAAICLMPIRYFRRGNINVIKSNDKRHMLIGSVAAGTIMFCAVGFQQIGIKDTTVANTGFITGLYIVFVPIIGVLLGHKYNAKIWLAILIACSGLYLLSGMDGIHMKKGDLFILISAFFWGSHLIVIDMVSNRHHPIAFAIRQFFICAALSFIAALVTGESLKVPSIDAWILIGASGIIAIALQLSKRPGLYATQKYDFIVNFTVDPFQNAAFPVSLGPVCANAMANPINTTSAAMHNHRAAA